MKTKTKKLKIRKKFRIIFEYIGMVEITEILQRKYIPVVVILKFSGFASFGDLYLKYES